MYLKFLKDFINSICNYQTVKIKKYIYYLIFFNNRNNSFYIDLYLICSLFKNIYIFIIIKNCKMNIWVWIDMIKLCGWLELYDVAVTRARVCHKASKLSLGRCDNFHSKMEYEMAVSIRTMARMYNLSWLQNAPWMLNARARPR